jgi:zinc transport system permease protein
MLELLDNFMMRAALAGIGMALACAPLGCFVVWRRMAYFGDATAHAAILGVCLGLALSLPVTFGILISSVAMALFVAAFQARGYASDTILGVMAHSALAFGLVIAALFQDVRIDLMAYLIGDILTVGRAELVLIWCGAGLVIGLLSWRWSPLITATLNQELAVACGVNPGREQLILSLALAVVVAVAIKIVGLLLIAAMLIIPPATARIWANSPEKMAIFAAMLGVVAVLGGLQLSLYFDTPTGPSIICLASVLFVFGNLASGWRISVN